MKQKNKLFVLLSAVILLLDITYVLMNIRLEQANFESTLMTDAKHMKSSYELAIEQQEQTMLAIATFIANEPTTTQLFYQGQQAIAAQRRGEPVTDAQINQYRQQLYQEVASAWREVQKEFSARQLHYHIEPGDISFLRVHKREKFGDDLTAVRHTIVDTHQFKNSRSGFETGRVYSGIRGVVPVFLKDDDDANTTYVGALEVGTSFDIILDMLDNSLDIGAAALLTPAHVEQNMWPEAIASHFSEANRSCACFIEASSRSEVKEILAAITFAQPLPEIAVEAIQLNGNHFAVTSFPLRDYLGEQQPALEPVGAILLWKNIDNQVAALQRSHWLNISFGIVGFFIIELLLYIAISKALRSQQHKDKLKRAAYQDSLTGLANRAALLDALNLLTKRQRQDDTLAACLYLDLDGFKAINDNFGHAAGDYLLTKISHKLTKALRSHDTVARIGGDEFVLLISALSNQEECLQLAQRLLALVNEPIPYKEQQLQVSASIGIIFLPSGESGINSAKIILAEADNAMYQAKRAGKNTIFVHEIST